MREKDFIGKIVVSMGDGAKVGVVKDLVFHGLDLTALLVNGERGEGLLPFHAISKNGPDAITIESYTLVDWNAGKIMEPDSRSTEDLRELSVVDAEGNILGKIHDVTMNAKGRVHRIGVRTEGVFGIGAHRTIVSGARVRAIGANMITVEKAQKK